MVCVHRPRRASGDRDTIAGERTCMAITLAQANRNAIAAEQAAEEFYLSMAESAGQRGCPAHSVDIAAQEQGHAMRLQDMAAALVQGDLPERRIRW